MDNLYQLIKKIAENTNNQLGSISGGMGLPPGLKLPF